MRYLISLRMCVCLKILIFCIYSCKDSSRNNQNLPIKNNDSLEIVNKIVSKNVDNLKKDNLESVNDSIKFYLYSVFYDKRVADDTINIPHFYCSYELLPIMVKIKDSIVMIEYQLTMPNERNLFRYEKPRLSLVQYNFLKRPELFNTSYLKIVNDIYEIERLKRISIEDIKWFIKSNGIKANEWYLSKLK